MIRVNLIGSAKGRGRRGGPGVAFKLPEIPNVGLLFALLLLVGIGAVIFSWRDSASATANQLTARIELRKMELQSLQARKKLIDSLTTETAKMKEQAGVFELLFADRVGPVNALTYLSFILQPREEATASPDELKALEAAGWRVAWDPRKVWLTSFKEAAGDVTLQGQALGHEDVAELMRRLESSPYFRETKLAFQERKTEDRLGASYVEFTIRGSLVYLIKPLHPAEPEAASDAPADSDGGPSGGDAVSGEPDGAQADGQGGAAARVPEAADKPLPKAEADDAQSGREEPDAGAVDAAVESAADATKAKAEAAKPAAQAKVSEAKSPPSEAKAPLPAAPPSVEAPSAPAADKLPAAEE